MLKVIYFFMVLCPENHQITVSTASQEKVNMHTCASFLKDARCTGTGKLK